ncbi:MAG TPA: ShlB/FhaC/HecB family hemolysin secretion/activation protein [Gammaproteobacteria bacterium]|nr:ShlB/FhaC/HecB family hemolysin secretion/activation protein [Gammaproteobacteria bacterium]
MRYRVLFRDQTNKIQAFLQLSRSDRDSYIDETLVRVASRRLASSELGMNFTHYSPDATLVVTPSLSHGLHWLGALSDPTDIGSDQPHANYTLFKLFALYNRRIRAGAKRSLSYRLTVNGQFSPVPLYGESQFILGGHYSVRGFKRNVLSADSGWSARNDLVVPVGRWTQSWHKRAWLTPLEFRVFADYGRVYAASGGYRGSLGGWGVGLDWHYRWFSLAYTHARAFHGAGQFAEPENGIDYINFTAQMTF